jgi:hypothetical protein
MDWDDYLRTEAAMYRQLAEEAENSFGKQELLDLAAVCEEVVHRGSSDRRVRRRGSTHDASSSRAKSLAAVSESGAYWSGDPT